jgi:RimJ/RimL family protein N-acetyltransferase
VGCPVLETPRLVLRRLVPDDLDALSVLHAQESFWHYPFRRGQTRDETRRFLERTSELYDRESVALAAVVLRANGELMGWAGLSIPCFLPEVLPAVEVGWRLGQQFWGLGYATEAGRAWVNHGFEDHGLEEILSIYQAENVASAAVMSRLGFRHDHETADPSHGHRLHVMKLTRRAWAGEVAKR